MGGRPASGNPICTATLTYNALLVEVQPLTPRKSCCGRSPADNSPRFPPTDGQTGTCGRRSIASGASVPRASPSPERRHNSMTSAATRTSRSLNVRTSDVHSCCNRNRQPPILRPNKPLQYGNDPYIRNDNWQRLCSPLPPVPVPQPAQLSRKSATQSRRRRHRQPHASGAHPCTAPCARRSASTPQLGSRTGFNLPSVLQRSMHTVPQQPARLMTSHGQQVCTPLLPTRRTGMRRQDNSPSPHCASNQTTTVRTTRAPVGELGHATLARAQWRNCRNIEPDQAHISNTNCIAVAAHRASRVSQPLRRFPRKTLPSRG